MKHFLERVWTDTPSMPRIARASAGAVAVLLACASPAVAQQVVADNLTLQTGDPQVLFDDTSVLQANDWRLGKNVSESGSENRFVLEDVTGARTPFQILAGAPTDSFFLSQSGNLGLGTSNPRLKLQMTSADTPAIRLEQTNSSFGAQTWDIGANEANFFVRDFTTGSRLPFRIRPGAPTSSIDVRGTEGDVGAREPAGHPGDVGIGTPTPTQALHVKRDDGTARLLVEETSTTEDSRVLTDLVNHGPALARFTNTAADGQDWQAGNRGATDFVIEPSGGSHAFTLTPSGDATAAGALLQNADPAGTESRAPVDGDQMLERITELPVESFEYADDESDARHVGPSGADFRAAFGLGASDATVAPGDIGGVTLAAIQALARNAAATDARVDGVTGRLGVVEGASGGDVGALKPIVTQLGDLGTKVTGLEAADTAAARKIKALKTTARKQNERLRRLERKLRALSKRR
jgi:hypothetical protein